MADEEVPYFLREPTYDRQTNYDIPGQASRISDYYGTSEEPDRALVLKQRQAAMNDTAAYFKNRSVSQEDRDAYRKSRYKEIQAQASTAKQDDIDRLRYGASQGMLNDPSEMPEMQEDYKDYKHPKTTEQLVREALDKADTPDAQIEVYSNAENRDWLLATYGLDGNLYGKESSVAAPENWVPDYLRVDRGIANALDTPGRVMRGSRMAVAKENYKNPTPYTLEDMEAMREEAAPELERVEEEYATNMAEHQDTGGYSVGPTGSYTRKPEPKRGNIDLEARRKYGRSLEDQEQAGLIDEAVNTSKALFSSFDDPESNYYKLSANVRDRYNIEARKLAMEKHGLGPEDAPTPEAKADAKLFSQMMWAAEDAHAVKNPTMLTFGQGLASDGILSAAGKPLFNAAARGVSSAKGAARGIANARRPAQGVEQNYWKSMVEGVKAAPTMDKLEEVGDISRNVGLAASDETAHTYGAAVKGLEKAEKNPNFVAGEFDAYAKGKNVEGANPEKVAGYASVKEGYKIEMDRAYETMQDFNTGNRLESRPMTVGKQPFRMDDLDALPAGQKTPEIPENIRRPDSTDLVPVDRKAFEMEPYVPKGQTEYDYVVKAQKQAHYVPAKAFKEAKEAGVESNFTAKSASARGAEQRRRVADETLVPNVKTQVEAAERSLPKKMEKRAFQAEAYRMMEDLGLVKTTDQVLANNKQASKITGSKNIIASDDSSSFIVLNGTDDEARAARASMDKAHPGVGFVVLDEKQSAEWLSAGLDEGTRVVRDTKVVIPKYIQKMAEEYDDIPSVATVMFQDIANPINRIVRNSMLATAPVKYVTMNAVYNPVVGYTALGPSYFSSGFGKSLGTAAAKSAVELRGESFRIFAKEAKRSKWWNLETKLANGAVMTEGEIVDAMMKYNVVNHARARQGFGKLIAGGKGAKPIPGTKLLNKAADATDIVGRLAYDPSAFFDEHLRATLFRKFLKGNTPKHFREAAKETMKVAGDFTKLNKFEKNVMRHTVSFYGWIKYSSQWGVKNLLKNPDKFRKFESAVDTYNKMYHPDKPLSAQATADWLRMRAGRLQTDDPINEKGQQSVRLAETPMSTINPLGNSLTSVGSPQIRFLSILSLGLDPVTGEEVNLGESAKPFIDLKNTVANNSVAYSDILKAFAKSSVTDATFWGLMYALPEFERVRAERMLGESKYMTSGALGDYYEEKEIDAKMNDKTNKKGFKSPGRFDYQMNLTDEQREKAQKRRQRAPRKKRKKQNQ